MICETCWAKAYDISLTDTSKTQFDHYLMILKEHRCSNAKPFGDGEYVTLASLKIQHAESGSDLSFAEWVKSPKSAQR